MSFIPSMSEISSKADLNSIVKEVREYRRVKQFNEDLHLTELFRGQGRDTWNLIPNLARKLNNSMEAREIERAISTEFNSELVKRGLSKSLQTDFLNKANHSAWLLLEQSQHYRIPTRFMDWTNDWEVALFFAVSNPSDDDFNGQFWIYLISPPKKMVTDSPEATYLEIDPFNYNELLFLNPSSFLSADYLQHTAIRRKTRQRGKFIVQPYENIFTPIEDQHEQSKYLTKILIPKSIKKTLREELSSDGITDENLYVLEDNKINEIVDSLRDKYHI